MTMRIGTDPTTARDRPAAAADDGDATGGDAFLHP